MRSVYIYAFVCVFIWACYVTVNRYAGRWPGDNLDIPGCLMIELQISQEGI